MSQTGTYIGKSAIIRFNLCALEPKIMILGKEINFHENMYKVAHTGKQAFIIIKLFMN